MVRVAFESDIEEVAKLASNIWSGEITSLIEDFISMIESEDKIIFIKEINNNVIGFAQCGLRRDYVEGTASSPVGYLEGIFIEEKYRKNGYARELLFACENWAKEKHCTEFASDCEIENMESLNFHLKLGFIEANRIICFTKKL